MPGATTLVTKKCTNDLFLTRPSPEINEALHYPLLEKAEKNGILLHDFEFLSNHCHLVVTDPRALLPRFLQGFFGETSAAIQVVTKTKQPVWASKEATYTRLLDLDAAIRSSTYTVLNTVRARLTPPGEWPGLSTYGVPRGTMLRAPRPDAYFSERRVDVSSSPIVSLAVAFGGDEAEVDGIYAKELARSEAALLQELRRKGQAFLGRDRVLNTSRFERGSTKHSTLRPRFASRDRDLRNAAIEDNMQFEIDHEKSRAKFHRGSRRAVFPLGTYGYRMMFGGKTVDQESPREELPPEES